MIIVMNQQQASQIIGTSKGANHQISKISQIQFSYSQKARQIRENNSVLGNGSIGNNISLKESDSSLIVNLQGIRDNPFAYINKDTTRDMLFRMAYLLEETNKELIYKFEVNKNYLLNQPEISAKYNISKADVQQRKTIIMQLKQKNLQNSAQVKLLELYQKQKQQLSQKLQLKHRAIEELSLKRKQKQEKRNQFNLMVKKSNERIIEFKKQKQRLTDEARRKKNNEKSADSGIVDRLLTEYYETIKEVLDEGSVDRINANTKAALCEVEKRKNAGFLNILKDNMQGLESNPQ